MPRQMMMQHPDDEDGDGDGGDGNDCDYDGDREVEHPTPVVFHLSALILVNNMILLRTSIFAS